MTATCLERIMAQHREAARADRRNSGSLRETARSCPSAAVRALVEAGR